MWTDTLVFIGLLRALLLSTHSQGGTHLEGDRGRNEITTTAYGPLSPPDCGFSNVTLRRIVGGEPASLGAWPWITALGYRNSRNPDVPKWLCGGSLISSRHVLTAAHCVHKRNDLYKVRIGELDLNNDFDGATPFEDFIERKTVHPQYKSSTLENDIAILKTTQEVPFTSTLHPICLPVDDFSRNRNLENTYPFIAGWGSMREGDGPLSSKLLQTQVPVRRLEECKNSYTFGKHYRFRRVIDDRFLCAGFPEGEKDSCQGDSGGPLMLPDPGNQSRFYLYGLISFGHGCARRGYPGVYTNVATFLDFITSNLVE